MLRLERSSRPFSVAMTDTMFGDAIAALPENSLPLNASDRSNANVSGKATITQIDVVGGVLVALGVTDEV